jgi:hypothetical protein
MKKLYYTLTLEFEAEVKGIDSNKKTEKEYYEKLLAASLKSKQSICELHRNLVVSDMLKDCRLITIKKDLNILKLKNEDEIIKQVLELLPAEVKNHFLKVLAYKDKRTDKFLENFFNQFGNLEIIGAHFREKCKSN